MKYFIIFILFACTKSFEKKSITAHKEYKAQTTINIKTYGAKGDGKTDDVNAFQKAEDYLFGLGGGILYVPKGTYIVSKAFYHRNLVTLIGDGDASIIKNKSNQSGPSQFCIYIGNFMPTTYGECVHYDCSPALKGSNQIVCLGSPSLYIGQAVLIDSKSGFMSSDGHWKPYKAFINRIVAISGNTITLEDALTEDINDLQIAPTNKFSVTNDTLKNYICQYPVIKNIRFESNGDWCMRFGVYKGLFQNISLKTTDVIPGNGFAWCTFKNIRAQFSQKVIEMAMYSHNTTVDSLTANWYSGQSDPDPKPLLKMGENCRDLRFSNIYINSGTANVNFNNVIRHEHSFNDTISNSHFVCKNVTGAGIIHEGDVTSFVTGNVCENNIFELGSTDYYIQFDKSKGATIENNIVQYNKFSGTVKDRIKGDTTNNFISPNYY